MKYTLDCKWCNDSFQWKNLHKKFCTPSCKTSWNNNMRQANEDAVPFAHMARQAWMPGIRLC